MTTIHVPVLLQKTLEYLINLPDGIYVDATVGCGGHFTELSARLNKNAILIGIDADLTALEYCQQNLNVYQSHRFIHSNFEFIKSVCFRAGCPKVHGILLDLGLSSFALDNPQRGFSYTLEGPLDMRFSADQPHSAFTILNSAEQATLETIFRDFGEERRARSLAKAIIAARQTKKINTTTQLAEIIRQIVPSSQLIKTLSRIFQALRIAVNRELEVLPKAICDAIDMLISGGRLVIISYHSLEDRIVKQQFKLFASNCICPPDFPICQCNHQASVRILTTKPIRPRQDEIELNPRARSAKLRAVEKL
jgi:16S rRNA (cytosine1402-N4)-methyltransferase